MEDGALAVARFLTILDLPISLVGMVVGIGTAIMHPGFRRVDRNSGTLIERLGVGLSLAVAALGLVGFVLTGTRRGFEWPPPAAALFVAAIFLLALPALVWRTKWRGVAEGIATLAVSLAAILSGFSIGFLFVPLVFLMIFVCVDSILRDRNSALRTHPRPVDSAL